jgi:benzoate membrane transport protein
MAALLVLATALIRPLGRLIERIPASIAAAMLAGVLLQFVLAVFESARTATYLVLPLVAVFLVARRVHAASAVLVTLAAGLAISVFMGLNTPLSDALQPPQLVLVMPRFEPSVLIGLGIPLYLVTMASQNLPGFAVLRAAGYQPPVGPLLGATGLASLASAPLGAHTCNMAAITASICTGPDTHPDASQRWKAGVVYGLVYLLIALAGASLVGIIAALPAALITTVAGLALVTPLLGALAGAMERPAERFAAVLTLAVTASGLSLFGIGSAFWGLLLGLLVLLLEKP